MRRSKPAPEHEFFPGFTDIVEIGVGSLANVYRAREIGTNRLVALKLLNVRDASPRALESFERESIALGAVSSHPNIVTLYRSFRAADERPVLVLELCRGSVGDRMHGGAGLPAAEVVALGIKIAGALETAHRAEILHRDVKPQNILLTEFGEPALADFGVAMLQSSTQTTAGLFDFTTLHAAPELLEGGETSAATDVYELASTLYQLIAGRAAFRAYEGESPASVILRILRDQVQPLVNTQAPASLSDLLLYAMSKDKASRPPTAAEFAAELATVEVEQQWPRTQFLIRDAGGGTSGLPTITRMPDARHRAAPAAPFGADPLPPPMGRPLAGAPPVPGADWSPPTVVRQAVEDAASRAEPAVLPGLLPALVEPRPTNERVVVERQVIERLVFERRPTADDGWSEVSIVQVRSEGSQPEPEDKTSDDVSDDFPLEPTPLQAWSPPPPPAVIEAAVPPPLALETREVRLADHEALSGSAPPEPDLAAIWGDVAELPPAPLSPTSTPSSLDPLPAPDPATRIDPPADEPLLDEPEEAETPLPFVPWRGAVTDPDPFDTGEHQVDPAALAGGVTPTTDNRSGQYPIPPSGVPDVGSGDAGGGTGTVPTWAFRAATDTPAGPASYGDLSLDPMSLRKKVSLRAGTSSLVVDDSGLALRMRMRRSSIPWSEVLGFEPRFDEGGRAARLVVLTHNGPVELAATRRPAGEVRYIHALLDAYRQRSAILGPR